MKTLPIPVVPSAAPRQLSMPFDSARLRGMTSSERGTVLARLASLFMEAAGLGTEERDDDGR